MMHSQLAVAPRAKKQSTNLPDWRSG